MNVNDKVRAPVGDKLVPAIIDRVEDAKGYRGSYPYQKVWVIFEDGSIKQYKDFDLYPVIEEEKKEKVAKKK